MNNINLIGRLTADVELKQTQNGVSVCQFTLAVDRPKVKDTTDFIPCVAWRNTAEFIARYFRKGNKIALTGVLTARKWQDKDGQNRTSYEVVADSVEFCESKNETKNDTAPAQPNYEELKTDDDLPF